MIATGGTIASKPTAQGLAPLLSAEELLASAPGLAEICRVESRQLFDLDSTNMRPEHWLQIAACIEENYDRFDGFVVTHGTDTLAYTAAALSYLVQRSIKPVVPDRRAEVHLHGGHGRPQKPARRLHLRLGRAFSWRFAWSLTAA